MTDDLAFELQIERAKREIARCVDVEHMRHLTKQMIDMMYQQRFLTRYLIKESAESAARQLPSAAKAPDADQG